MALPGHSPPPFAGPGSPTRIMNGHIETQHPPMYGPSARTMMPPSPQHYRFPNPMPSHSSQSLSTMNDSRNPPPYKRPESSMSISSMLGGEPEKHAQDVYRGHQPRGVSRPSSISAPTPNAFSIMSPPQQQPSKPGLGDYSYKPRSQTPDRIGTSFSPTGARQRSSSSGTPLQRPSHFAEQHHHRSVSTIPAPRYLEQTSNAGYPAPSVSRNEQDERIRRTSLSGILQRPNSQPQSGYNMVQQHDPFGPTTTNHSFSERAHHIEPINTDPFQRNGISTPYDIKPPGPQNAVRPNDPQLSPTRGPSMPTSPDAIRPSANGTQGRTLASILNGPASQLSDLPTMNSSKMNRQDSAQSHTDRAIFGDRGKIRQYSPFASPFVSQSQPAAGTNQDEQGRKGSDELSQHRILLGLAAESKRGRYSPMPQVMQGAQAHTPIPDAGVKEHGRVFSGLGGGIGTTPTPTPASLKRDEGRTPLSEDNLMKMSRSASGMNKRARKIQDEDGGADTNTLNGGKVTNGAGRSNKKGKHQHSYKTDLEEMSNQAIQRRNTPLTGFHSGRNMSTTSNSGPGNQAHPFQHQRAPEPITVPKPRKTIKVASVFNSASRSPRRHIGNFTYRPEISQTGIKKPNSREFDISIRPSLIPSFSGVEHINCTYTIHVSKTWLQDRERGLICAEQFLWGSGIYTDDSDPIAAAIHAGFLKPSFRDNIDASLLSRIVSDQNPRIEWPKNMQIPERPAEIDHGKDLNITLVVLPLLEHYEGSARFGIRSRTWPDNPYKTQHDGVSFGVLKIEFVNVGQEEMRIGRTGVSRRERLRRDLEARQRGFQIQSDRIAKAKSKRLEQIKGRKSLGVVQNGRHAPTSAPVALTNGSAVSSARHTVAAVA